jgi:hypothetical protein
LLKKKLGGQNVPITKDAFGEYNVRVRAISNPSIRGAAELYGIAVYMPKANGSLWRKKKVSRTPSRE